MLPISDLSVEDQGSVTYSMTLFRNISQKNLMHKPFENITWEGSAS